MPPEPQTDQEGTAPKVTTDSPQAEAPKPPTTEGATELLVDDGDAQDSPKVYQVPESEFRKLKDKAHQKGFDAATAEFVSKAKEAGFKSIEEAFNEVAQMKARLEELESQEPVHEEPTMTKPKNSNKRNGRTRQSAPQNGERKTSTRSNGKRNDSRYEKEIARLSRDKTKATEKWRREERKRKELQRKLDAQSAEMELRQVAVQQGCKDVDYAIRLLTREAAKKSPEERAEFDEVEFFKGLKQSKPYLFGEEKVPATTGTGAGSEDTPPEPKPGDVSTSAAGTQQFDARTATPDEVKARLKQLGLKTSGVQTHG